MKQEIIEKIKCRLHNISSIEVKNNSESHAGHAGYNKNSHFEILIESEDFAGLTLLQRHRIIFEALGKLKSTIHSISLKLYTKNEYKNK